MDDSKKLKRELGFDLYGRHALIQAIIDANRQEGVQAYTVLDIGGRGNILQRFLPHDQVSYLDPLVESADPNYIAGDGCDIPLPDNSIDWVVSVDTFEHITPALRAQFLAENTRVAKRGMILVAPFFNTAVVEAERHAADLYTRLTGTEHPWLSEHLEYGLPQVSEVEQFVAASSYQLQQLNNNDLGLWQTLLCINLLTEVNAYPAVQQAIADFNEFYNTEIFPLDTGPESYRKIFFIKKDATLVDLTVETSGVPLLAELKTIEQAFGIVASIDAVNKKVFKDTDTAAKKFHQIIAAKDQDITNLQAGISELRQAWESSTASASDAAASQQALAAALTQAEKNLHRAEQQLAAESRQLAQTTERLVQTTEKLQQTTERLVQAQLGLADANARNTELAQTLAEHTATIAWMEASLFWRLRNHYLAARQLPQQFGSLAHKARVVQQREGLVTAAKFFWLYLKHGRDYFKQRPPSDNDYAAWMETHERYDLRTVLNTIQNWPTRPLISILLPVYNTPPHLLEACVASVMAQWYPHFQLCIYDDGSTDPGTQAVIARLAKSDERIVTASGPDNHGISAASNAALALATGDYIALLDHDDVLARWALYEVAAALHDHPDAQYIYSDEDNVDLAGKRFNPFFKPDWNPDLLLSMMYTSHLSVYAAGLVRQVDGFRSDYDGAQDYDLLLRAMERITPEQIHHIPKILYHWRVTAGSTAAGVAEKPQADSSAKAALSDYLTRNQIAGRVDYGRVPGRYRLQRDIVAEPLVSIIIPFRDQVDVLRRCLGSIIHKTTYLNYELVLMDNQSSAPETAAYLQAVRAKHSRVRVLRYDQPFNFSAINNAAAREAEGELLLFLNNDTEVITPDWLTALVEQGQRPEVGAVGAKLFYPNNTIQHAGVILLGGEYIAGHAMKYFPRSHTGYFSMLDVVRDYSALTGACLLVPKTVFDAVGGFNEIDLAVAYNDVDLCLRIGARGYHVVYTPYAELYHYESLTRGDDEHNKQTDAAVAERLKAERAYMHRRWHDQLENDPAYSPHLSHTSEDFRIRT